MRSGFGKTPETLKKVVHDPDQGTAPEVARGGRGRPPGSRPLAVVHRAEIGRNPPYFYQEHGGQPVIVRGTAGMMPTGVDFLGRNWLEHLGHGDRMAKPFAVPAGHFSRLRVEPWGSQRWLYLARGQFLWALYPPAAIPLIYDFIFREFYHPLHGEPGRFPLAEWAPRHVGIQHARELIFVPAGWAFQVEALEESSGLWGGVLNEYQVLESVRSWLLERSLGINDATDIKGWLQSDAFRRASDQGCWWQIEQALEQCQAWEQNALHITLPGLQPDALL